MARYSLADQLEKKIGTRTEKGTLITKRIVDNVRSDEAIIITIEEDNTEQIINAIDQALAAALEDIGLKAEGFAKGNLTRNHSVDTGRLRNSVTHALSMDESSVYIGTNVEYAAYVELGTSRADPKPYLVPAITEHEGYYRDLVREHMQNG